MIAIAGHDDYQNELDVGITNYINANLEESITVALDFVNDGLDVSCFFERFYIERTSREHCVKLMNQLYDLVTSASIRNEIEPIYQLLLFTDYEHLVINTLSTVLKILQKRVCHYEKDNEVKISAVISDMLSISLLQSNIFVAREYTMGRAKKELGEIDIYVQKKGI